MTWVYHEKQENRMCGKHCINNLLQAPIFDDKRMRTIAKKVDKLASQLLAEEELPVESDHFNTEGDFSIEVLKAALIRVNADLIPSRHPDASRIFKERDFYALVVQSHNHWFAVRRIGKLWVNLDSLFLNPDIIRDEEFKRWVQTNASHHNVFFVVGDIHIDHVRQEKVEPWILLHTDGSVTQTTGSLLRARDASSPGGSSNKFHRDNGNLNNNYNMDNGNSPIKNPRGFDNSNNNNMEQQPMPMPMLIADDRQRAATTATATSLTTTTTSDREQQLHRQRERQGNQRREQQVHAAAREREQELLELSRAEEKQLQLQRERERQEREAAAKEREEEREQERQLEQKRQKEEERQIEQELERVQRLEQEQAQERQAQKRERQEQQQAQEQQAQAQGQGRNQHNTTQSDQEQFAPTNTNTTISSRKQTRQESSASESPRDSPRERRERREEKKRQKQRLLDASTPSTGSRAEGWTSPRVKEKNGFMMKEAKISPSTSKDKMMTGTVETIKEEKDERSVPQKLLDLGFDKSEVKFVAHLATDMDKAEEFFTLEPLIEKSDLQKENHTQRVTIEVSRCVKDIFDASTGGPVEMALFQLFRISQLGQALARVIVLSSARYAIDLKQNLLTAVGRKLASEYFSKLEREFDNFARMKDMGFLDLEIRCALSMYTTSLGMAQACDILAQEGDSESLRHPELLGLLIASTNEDEAKAMLLRVVQFVVRNPDACTSDEVVDALKTQRRNLGSTGFQAATRLLEFMDNPGHLKRVPPTIPSMSSIMEVDVPKNGRLRRPPSMGALGSDDYHQTKDYKTVETFDTFNRMQEPTRALTQGSLKQGHHYSTFPLQQQKNGLTPSSDNDNERRKPAPPNYSATSPSLYAQQRETIVLEKKTAVTPSGVSGSGSTSQLYGTLGEREASFRNNYLNVTRGDERAMNQHNNTTKDKDERRQPNNTTHAGGGGASSSYQTYTSSGTDNSSSLRGGLHSTPMVPSSTMKGSRKEPGMMANIVPSSDATPPGRGGPGSSAVGHTPIPTRSSPTQPGMGIPDKASLSLKPKTTLGVTKMGTFPQSGLSRGISERGGPTSGGEQHQGLYTHSSPQHTSSGKSGGGAASGTTTYTHHHASTKTSPQKSFVMSSPQQSSSQAQGHAQTSTSISRRKEASSGGDGRGGGGGFALSSSAAGRSASLKASATKASSSTSVPQTDKVNLNSGYRPNMYTSGLGPDSLRRSHTPDSREERYGDDRRENPKMRSRDDRENSTRSISARVPDGRMRSEETLTTAERNRYQDHTRTYESDRVRDHIPKTIAYSSIDREGPFSRERTTAAEERRVAREPIDRDIYGRPRDPTTRDVYGRAIDPERGNLFERPLDRYERSMQRERERERERERNESAAYAAENNVSATGPGRRNYGERDYFTTTDQILADEGRRIYAPKIGMDERGMSIGDYGRIKESYTRDPYTNIRGGVPSYANDVPRAREETKRESAAYGSDEHFYSRLWETRNSSSRRSHSTKDPWRFP